MADAAARPPGAVSGGFGTPLQNYLARSTGKIKQNTNGAGVPIGAPEDADAEVSRAPLSKLGSAKYANFRPFVRANFR